MPTDGLVTQALAWVFHLAQKCFAVLSVARQATGAIIMSRGYLPNKIQCFCGKFRHLGRSRSVLLPALASQGPSSRTGQTRQIALTGSQNLLEACKILPEYSFHESMHSSAQNAKPRMTPKGLCSCRSAAESRRVCNADLLPQLSSPPNPT